MRSMLGLVALAGVVLCNVADAEVIRFRYVPVDACGTTALVRDPQGATGQRSVWIGGVKEPYFGQFKANFIVTFRHPDTGRNLNVPMTLPESKPRMEYRRSSIVYNYGSYTIEALFLADGAIEIIYNSGLLRPLQP